MSQQLRHIEVSETLTEFAIPHREARVSDSETRATKKQGQVSGPRDGCYRLRLSSPDFQSGLTCPRLLVSSLFLAEPPFARSLGFFPAWTSWVPGAPTIQSRHPGFFCGRAEAFLLSSSAPWRAQGRRSPIPYFKLRAKEAKELRRKTRLQ